MNILILYASYSGGTMQAAQIIHDAIVNKGATATMKLFSEAKPAELDEYDVIVLGSPSWNVDGKEGQPHEDCTAFMQLCADKTIAKSFAVFGLGDESYEYYCGAVSHLETFIQSVHGTIKQPSLKINGFFFDLEGNTKLLQEWAQKLVP